MADMVVTGKDVIKPESSDAVETDKILPGQAGPSSSTPASLQDDVVVDFRNLLNKIKEEKAVSNT